MSHTVVLWVAAYLLAELVALTWLVERMFG